MPSVAGITSLSDPEVTMPRRTLPIPGRFERPREYGLRMEEWLSRMVDVAPSDRQGSIALAAQEIAKLVYEQGDVYLTLTMGHYNWCAGRTSPEQGSTIYPPKAKFLKRSRESGSAFSDDFWRVVRWINGLFL